MKPHELKRLNMRVRETLVPISFNVPPALDSGAEDTKPAMKRSTSRAGALGATAQAISKIVARKIVPT